MAPYGRLLSAGGLCPPPPYSPPTPCIEYLIFIFLPPFFYRGAPPIPPHCCPPYPLHRVFYFAAIFDFEVDVKNMTYLCKKRNGKRDGGKGTRLGFLCGCISFSDELG